MVLYKGAVTFAIIWIVLLLQSVIINRDCEQEAKIALTVLSVIYILSIVAIWG